MTVGHESERVNYLGADPVPYIGRVDDRLVRTFDTMTKLANGVFGSALLRWTVHVIWALLMVPVL